MISARLKRPLPRRVMRAKTHPDLQHGMRPGGVPVEFRLGIVQALLSPVEVLQQLGWAATRQPRQALHVTGTAAHSVRRAGLPEPQRGAADLSREEVADLAGFAEGRGLSTVRIKVDPSIQTRRLMPLTTGFWHSLLCRNVDLKQNLFRAYRTAGR
jgi:hypothetical protein